MTPSPRGKHLLFLDRGRLQLTRTRTALQALNYHTFCTIFYGHTLSQLAYFFVSNCITTNAMDSVPPREKARDALLFLDSGILWLVLTRAALDALHYRTFYTIFYGHPIAQCN